MGNLGLAWALSEMLSSCPRRPHRALCEPSCRSCQRSAASIEFERLGYLQCSGVLKGHYLTSDSCKISVVGIPVAGLLQAQDARPPWAKRSKQANKPTHQPTHPPTNPPTHPPTKQPSNQANKQTSKQATSKQTSRACLFERSSGKPNLKAGSAQAVPASVYWDMDPPKKC